MSPWSPTDSPPLLLRRQRLRGTLRFVRVSWWLHLKAIAVSPFEGFLQVVWPLFFATLAMMIYGVNGDQDALIYAALGAAIMGMWSSMSTTATSVLQRERYNGTLELLASSPTPFALVVTPITVALATVGIYSVAATLIWVWVLFGVSVVPVNVLGFALALVVAVLATGLVGFVLSLVSARYRTAWALGNVLEYPGWLVCGFIIPLAFLPSGVRWISYGIPPTWAISAIRKAAEGSWLWTDLGICISLTIGYGILGVLLSKFLLKSARKTASISLS